MPLRIIRSPTKARDVLFAATAFASITVDVSDMVQFTPVRAAAGILLAILQTIQEMDANRDACFRLARHAARVLIDLRRRMDGRWDTAPPALIENIHDFERVLVTIRDYMQELSKLKWVGRLLNKHNIEDSLADYTAMLDEAERAFQTATLIEIHYSVNLIQQQQQREHVVLPIFATPSAPSFQSQPVRVEGAEHLQENTPPPYEPEQFSQSETVNEISERKTVAADTLAEPSPITEEIDNLMKELEDIEKSGFKRYHQSDVRLKSALKSSTDFWTESSYAEVDRRQAVVKRYDGNDPVSRWIHDVKRLRNLYHPNLPQMIGFSDESTPTPFVILAKVKLRDPNAFVWNALQNKSIADCAATMLRMYRDVTSATLYVQRQMSLNESETQDFVSDASYSLDGDGNVIVGLPPPKNGNWVTVRNYNLVESLVSTCMKNLPDVDRIKSIQGTSDANKQIELQNKFLHVRSLTRALLPASSGSSLTLSDDVDQLLEQFEDDEDVCLAKLRRLTLQNDHGNEDYVQAWHESLNRCDVEITAGDIGYIAANGDSKVDMMDKTRFNSFIKIGNVAELFSPVSTFCHDHMSSAGQGKEHVTSLQLEGYSFAAVKETSGTLMQWVNGFMQRQTTWPFSLPNEIEGWSVLLQPQEEKQVYVRHQLRLLKVTEAWRYLLQEARKLADVVVPKVQPHEIILVTRSMKAQIYIAKHFGQPPFMHGHSLHMQNPFGLPNPTLHRMHHPGQLHIHNNAHFMHRAPPPPIPGQIPQMVHLFTSPRPNFEPFWAEDPSMAMVPAAQRGPPPRHITTRVAWPGAPEASIDYVQLSQEDFE